MAKDCQFATLGTDPTTPLEISIRPSLWPILQSHKWFLPRFKVVITNKGKMIEFGNIEIDIVEYSNISDFAVYKGPFQDVFHREIRKLDAGKKLKFKLRIESRFLRPTTYMLRIYLIRWVPVGSIMDEIEEAISQPKDMSEESKARAMSSAVEFFAKRKVDLFAPRMNTWKGKLLADWRWMEIIKIFPLWEVMAVFSAGIAALSLLLGLIASNLSD